MHDDTIVPETDRLPPGGSVLHRHSRSKLMRNDDLNHQRIELAIARARQERAQDVANLFRRLARAIRNGWVALFGIRRKLPRKRTPLSDDEQRLLRPPPVAILMNALHAPDRCGDAVIGKYRRLTKEFKR